MKTFLISFFLVFILTGITLSQTTYENLTKGEVLTDQLPIRDVRKTAVWFNMGWNGIVGFGPVVSTYPAPKIAIDAGIGLSSEGVKLSGRGRYLFLTKNFTPFAGLGFMYGFGSKSSFERTDSYNSNNDPYWIKINDSPFLQIVGGFEYMAKKGFFTLFNIGYAILLKDTNYEVTSGFQSKEMKRIDDAAFGSGIVIEGGIGFAF